MESKTCPWHRCIGGLFRVFPKPLFHGTCVYSLLKQVKSFLVISLSNGVTDASSCFSKDLFHVLRLCHFLSHSQVPPPAAVTLTTI